VFFVDVKLTVFAGRAGEFPRKYRVQTRAKRGERVITAAPEGIRRR
jgi:hypothetical protein